MAQATGGAAGPPSSRSLPRRLTRGQIRIPLDPSPGHRYRRLTMRLRTFLPILALAALALGVSPRLDAQESDTDLRSEIEQLKQGQQQIQKQIQELKRLVQAQARPAAAPRGPDVAGKEFDLGDNPVKGASTAKLTLVEFTDYQ